MAFKAERPKIYVVQTTNRVIERCLLMTTDPGDLVLDPTCGSGTTAYVAEQWGRRWITIDTSRVALALARTRLMSARFPYYLLADSAEGAKKEAELTGATLAFGGDGKTTGFGSDIKRGFVYKRVPHVTLKSIANNEEIDAIYGKWQEQLEPLRAEVNGLLAPLLEKERGKGVRLRSGRFRGSCPGAIQNRKSKIQDRSMVGAAAGEAKGNRRLDCAARRHRAAVRSAVRGQQAHPRNRAVHGRKPLAPPDALERGAGAEIGNGCQGASPGRPVRDDDYREPRQGGRAERAAKREIEI